MEVVHYDEEDCLGLELFVAELELVLGARDHRPDQAQLLELLQKLLISIGSADAAAVKRCQRRCEAALADLLRRGACPVVRSLACACMSKLFAAGDLLPLYGRASELLGELADKGGAASESQRLAAMELLTQLFSAHGRALGSFAAESASIAAKAVGPKAVGAPRLAGLQLAVAVVDGLNPLDRSAAAVHAEAWKLFDRNIKDKAADDARALAAALAGALARAGGSALWANAGAGWEEACRACAAALEDPSEAVREAAAFALAELAACPSSPELGLTAALDAEKKPARRTALEKAAAGAFKAALVAPFVDAAVQGKREACVALASAWVSYAQAMAARGKLDADGLVDLGAAAVSMLEACSKASAAAEAAAAAVGAGGGAKSAGGAAAETPLGACLSGGEMPHAQACVIYMLRVGITRQLQEQGQRRLLERLASIAAGGIAPPLVIAALEGVGALIEVLGEVDGEAAVAVEQVISSKITSPSSAVRHQAASALAALALAAPPLMAKLLGSYLEAVEAGAQTLQMLAAPYSKPGVVGSSRLGPGEPRACPDSQTRHAVDALHGAALAVGALLVAGARSPLGVPSRLPRSAFWIAKRMILQPYCSAHWAAAAERDAGYLLLGCLCAGGASPDVLVGLAEAGRKAGAGGDALALFAVALGPGAREALDERTYAGRPNAEAELAVALWWRASALQALSAYALGVVSKGLVAEPQEQVQAIAEMATPLLEALAAQPALADPGRSPAAAAASSGAAPEAGPGASSRMAGAGSGAGRLQAPRAATSGSARA